MSEQFIKSMPMPSDFKDIFKPVFSQLQVKVFGLERGGEHIDVIVAKAEPGSVRVEPSGGTQV